MAAEAAAGVEKTDSNTEKKMQIILDLPRPGSDTVGSSNTDKTISLEVSSSDTVASLNARIGNIRGIPLCRQRLVVTAQPWPPLLDPSKPDRRDSTAMATADETGNIITENTKMQIFVVLPRPSGLMEPNTIALEVCRTDTVANLKARLEDIDGADRRIPPCRQRLVFTGSALPDDNVTTLAELGVGDSSTVQLVETGMGVYVQDFRVRCICNLSSTDTVDTLKARCEAMEGVPADRQRLTLIRRVTPERRFELTLYPGRVELENGRTLADYGVRDWSWVSLRRLRWNQTDAFMSLGRVLAVKVLGTDTVGDVKRTVKAKAGVPVAAQRAYHTNKRYELEDLEDGRSMEELGIMVSNGDVIGPPQLYIECRQDGAKEEAAEGRLLPCRPFEGDLGKYYESQTKKFLDRAKRREAMKENMPYWRRSVRMEYRILHVFLEAPDPLLP